MNCRPGGVALFAPDFTAETYTAATDHGDSDDAGGRGARYRAWTRDPDPDDTGVQTEYAFVLCDADGSARAVHESHRTGLFGGDVWLGLLAQAGFEPLAITEETTEDRRPRELFVGRKALSSESS